MKFIQYICDAGNPPHSGFNPGSSICVHIDFFHFIQIIVIVDVFINLIPECGVFFPITGSAKIVRINKSMALTFWGFFFYPFMNINKLCYQTIVFPVILVFFQITFFIPKLQGHMVFICFDIEILYFFFILRFFRVFRKLQCMNLIFDCLFFHICCQAGFFSTSSV